MLRLPSFPVLTPALETMLNSAAHADLPNLLQGFIHLGSMEASSCRVSPVHDVSCSMHEEIPHHILFSKACMDCGVVAASSQWIAGRVGLFPTKKFNKGSLICTGTSEMGFWMHVDDTQATMKSAAHQAAPTSRTSVVVILELTRMFRSSQSYILAGQPQRDVWAAMQVTTAGSQVKPTVRAEIQPGELGNECLCFMALEDMEPFSCELIWSIDDVAGCLVPGQGYIASTEDGATLGKPSMAGSVVVAEAAAIASAKGVEGEETAHKHPHSLSVGLVDHADRVVDGAASAPPLQTPRKVERRTTSSASTEQPQKTTRVAEACSRPAQKRQ